MCSTPLAPRAFAKRRAGRPRFDEEREPDELRRPEVRDVNVVRRVGAAHVERVVRALVRTRPKAREELLGLVEARRLEPAVREVGHLDDRHRDSPFPPEPPYAQRSHPLKPDHERLAAFAVVGSRLRSGGGIG